MQTLRFFFKKTVNSTKILLRFQLRNDNLQNNEFYKKLIRFDYDTITRKTFS